MRAAIALAVLAALVGSVEACGGAEASPLRVTWDDAENGPACRYLPATRTVVVRLRIDGDAGDHRRVTATVTAYEDENTSVPVGTARRTVRVHGIEHRKVELEIATRKPPHVGEDDVAACRLSVTYRGG